MSEATLPVGQVDLFAALALNPKAGEKFKLADRPLTRSFLRIDAEDALTAVILDVVTDAAGKPLRAMLLGAMPKTREAAAIIVADLSAKEYEDFDEEVEKARAWIRSTRGVTNAALLNLVLNQVKLQEMGALLGNLWAGAVHVAAMMGTGHSFLPTSDQ